MSNYFKFTNNIKHQCVNLKTSKIQHQEKKRVIIFPNLLTRLQKKNN